MPSSTLSAIQQSFEVGKLNDLNINSSSFERSHTKSNSRSYLIPY
ncbi:MAG TPA: hypothetical protein V6D30_02090 [Leptolyngbyaceae cyanobacterium]